MPKHDQSIAGLEALAQLIEIAQRDTGRSRVLYVYRCTVCGHRAEFHLPDDSHDGEATVCAACGAPVRIEWDGGVTFEA
jgi:rRNA maturation endonuclease Nob1